MDVERLADSLLNVSMIVAAIAMFTVTLPRRPHSRRTLALALGALFGSTVLSCVIGADWMATKAGVMPLELEFAPFTLLLLGSILVVWLCFDVPVETALFACTAGYTTQNLWSTIDCAFSYTVPFVGWGVGGLAVIGRLGWGVAIGIAVYLAVWHTYGRHVTHEGMCLVRDNRMFPMVAIVILMNIVFTSIIKSLMLLDTPPLYIYLLSFVNSGVCVLFLSFEMSMLDGWRMEREVETVTRILEGERRQYEMSRENIAAINLKCHDLRHQIRHLNDGGRVVDQDVLHEMARAVDVYDATYRTGNEALDTILTEKALRCRRDGISLSCICDGRAMDFMRPADIYSLFGNALDNAIEAVGKIDDLHRSTVCVKVRRRGAMVAVHVANPYDGELDIRDGLPRTTKADKLAHGWGTRSIQVIAQRYGGTMAIKTQDQTYSLNLLFPADA